jgi:hypothetical protein
MTCEGKAKSEPLQKTKVTSTSWREDYNHRPHSTLGYVPPAVFAAYDANPLALDCNATKPGGSAESWVLDTNLNLPRIVMLCVAVAAAGLKWGTTTYSFTGAPGASSPSPLPYQAGPAHIRTSGGSVWLKRPCRSALRSNP